MNLKTHKIIVSIALTLVLCTGAALLAQALFQAFTGDVAGTVTVTPPAAGSVYYVTVSTEAELIAATKAVTYNDPNSNSEAETTTEAVTDDQGNTNNKTVLSKSSRCVILLTDHIVLQNDLTVTRDCHVNLNGKTLDLNGHTVNVFHTYSGAFLIANGTLTSSKVTEVTTDSTTTTQTVKGTVNVNTPNAAVLVDATYDTSLVTVNTSALDNTKVCTALLSMVCAHLSNSLGDHGIYGLLNTVGADPCTLPVMSSFGCSHANGCCFITDDIDLPYWFFDYEGLQITYKSSNESILDNYGRVTGAGVVTLTVTVTYNGAQDDADYVVHVLNSDADYAKAAIAILQHDLAAYKVGDNYNFDTPIALPGTMMVGSQSVTMGYAAPAGADGAHTTIHDSGNYTVYTTTSEAALDLTITATAGTSTATGTIPTTGHASDVEETEYTQANRIIKQLFGGGIKIYKDDEGVYTSQSLAYNTADYPASYKFTGITYELVGDNNNSYAIDGTDPNQTLIVTGTPEQFSVVDNVFLRATLKINGIDIVINVPVKLVDRTVAPEGGTVAQFLPYYHYFDQLFSSTTGNYTYRDFTFPTGYPNSQVQIELYLVDPETFEFGEQSNAFLTISEVAGEWRFDIDPEEIGLTDQNLILGYRYTLNGSKWENFDEGEADGKFSYLTVPGVVNREDDCTDPALYEMLYHIYHPESYVQNPETQQWYWDYTVPSDDEDGDYILASRLSRTVDEKQLNFSSTGVTTVKNYKGIELLSGATGINLDGALVREDVTTNFATMTTYLTRMTNLEYLNLANNGITDGNGGFNATTDVIAPLTTLTKMKEIHLESDGYVFNNDGEIVTRPDHPNSIYDFSSLTDFPALEKAYVYGNYPEYTGMTGILAFLNGILTDVVQQVSGSTGATNLPVYATLHARGVEVYNEYKLDNENNLIPFSPESDVTNQYLAFTSVEYQDKLLSGVDISTLYSTMSKDPQAYGIAKKQSTSYYTYEAGNENPVQRSFQNSISFKTVSDTQFAIVYKDYIVTPPPEGSENNFWAGLVGTDEELAFYYELEFKFDVTRVDENGDPITNQNP